MTSILLPVLTSDKVAGWPKDNNVPCINYVDAGEACLCWLGPVPDPEGLS